MDYLPFLMLPVAFTLMFLGFPVAFCMMVTAVLFGLVVFGDKVVYQFIEKIDDIASNFVLAAVPLFVFMGSMLERSGIANQLFEAIHIWTRRLPGGLALATVIMCILFAASSGVIGATESVVGLAHDPDHAALRLRQGTHLGRHLRGRLARHDHPAVGGRGRDRPARRRFGRRHPLRHELSRAC